jgi:hypothetical protein
MKRTVSEVIDQITPLIPADEYVGLLSDLKKLQTSARYTAPELMRDRWTELAYELTTQLPDLSREDSPKWAIDICLIVSGKDPRAGDKVMTPTPAKLALPHWDGDPKKCTIILPGSIEKINGEWFLDGWVMGGRGEYVPKDYEISNLECVTVRTSTFGGYTMEELLEIWNIARRFGICLKVDR